MAPCTQMSLFVYPCLNIMVPCMPCSEKPEIEHMRKELEHAKQAVRKLSVAEAQRKLSGSDSIGHPIMDVQSVITQ